MRKFDTDNFFGFRKISEKSAPDIDATLYEAEHIKSGARLLFIDREDSNKTFSISFKTTPENDTGVFHIIEHSVLCGSEKYPVKEPFVELLKSSLKTFLNAFTFPDKTVYPVSSRDDADFLNLTRVYLDAVFNPIMKSKPEIFYQEGWHYEPTDDGGFSYKGVVFNEMKGAYSSVDELEMEYMTKLLYPDSCYGYDSGGEPSAITSLTYEDFVSAHDRFYHPSNSIVILDGSVDLEKTLPLIDEYLGKYEKTEVNANISWQNPVSNTATKYFELAKNESADNKCRVCLGFCSGAFDDPRRTLAMAIAIDAISGSNEAPFKAAMLGSGICEDIYFTPYDGVQQPAVLLEIKNVSEARLTEARDMAIAQIRSLAEGGIDKAALNASLCLAEFRARERESAYPQGLMNSFSALEVMLYGGDAARAFNCLSEFDFLREAISTDYFDKLLLSLIDCEHNATLYMLPDNELGERLAVEEKARLDAALKGKSEAELDGIREANERLVAWQSAPDSPESLATLPRLKISDISRECERIENETCEVLGRPFVFTKTGRRGIAYTTYLFDITDFNERELFLSSLLTDILKNTDTENKRAAELQTEIKTELGSFGLSAYSQKTKTGARAFFSATTSALLEKTARSCELVGEVLLNSVFRDEAAIGRIIRQIRIGMAEGFSQSGHQVALARASAGSVAAASISEYLDGVDFYLMIKELDERPASELPELFAELRNICKKIFVRERLTVFVGSQEADGEYARAAVSLFPNAGEKICREAKILPRGVLREGIIIPAQVGYSGIVGNILSDGCESLPPSMAVVRNILSFEYLWGEVRVKGGAYGAGLIQRPSGAVGCYSYRDPNPCGTLAVCENAPRFLREFAASGSDFSGHVIGAVGELDRLMTPRVRAALGVSMYIAGKTNEERRREREEILNTDRSELLRLSDMLEGVMKNASVCIVGGRDKITELGDKINKTIEI